MKKTEFIDLLRKKLSIIEENELNDILDEYEQHITMKMESGKFTEEEAIEDFGDLNQLTAEILEAYHVRTNYAEYEKKEKMAQLAEKSKEYAGKTAGFFSRLCDRISLFFKKLGESIKRFFSYTFKSNKKENKVKLEKEPKPLKPYTNSSKEQSLIKTISNGVKLFINFLASLIKWCIQTTINVCLIFLGGIVGILTALNFIAFSMLIVLLFAGYPILGITIISLGTLMCGSSFIIFIFSFLIKKENSKFGREANE